GICAAARAVLAHQERTGAGEGEADPAPIERPRERHERERARSRRRRELMHNHVLQFFDYLNTIILIYFLVANAIYSVLMVLSLYAVSIPSRYAAHTGFSDLMDSPVTPPVALLVPAYNEQDVIVATVESMLELKYPEKEVIVIDDGSEDATLHRLIERFHLQKMDL